MPHFRITTALLLALAALCSTPSNGQDASLEPPPRPVLTRVAVVSVTSASGFLTGLALGVRDGLANDVRHAATHYGYGSPQALQLNEQWHQWGWVTKPALVVNFAGGIAIGHVFEPDLLEGVLLAASWGAGVGLGFHFGHNWQQAQRWDYFGSIDSSDQMANTIGPQIVVIGAVAGGVCLFYLTYQALR